MVLDTSLSLLSALYTVLTGDATLKAAMGGTVRLYPIGASEDAVFPYLVHRIDGGPVDDFWPVRQSTYQLDAWSQTDNVSEILAIRKRIIELLDEYQFEATEFGAARLWLQTDGFIPDDLSTWHYTFQWNLRFYRITEAAAVIAR